MALGTGGRGAGAGDFEVEGGGGEGEGGFDPPLPPHAERKPAPANTMKSRRLTLFFMFSSSIMHLWIRASSALVAVSN
jgi:hypothetical protein